MAFPTPSGGMIRFRFEGFFPRVGKSQLPVRKAPLSSGKTPPPQAECQVAGENQYFSFNHFS
jgi:hypothetical protein